MEEKLKALDFNNLNEEETNNILSEMLLLNDDDLKQSVYIIIDSIEYDETENSNVEELSVFYKTIFSNDKIKEIMQNILEEYEKNVE